MSADQKQSKSPHYIKKGGDQILGSDRTEEAALQETEIETNIAYQKLYLTKHCALPTNPIQSFYNLLMIDIICCAIWTQ